VRELVDSMYPLEYAKGSYVIREGEAGMVWDISVPVFLSLPVSFTFKITVQNSVDMILGLYTESYKK
jgi:hypothetical protein